MSGKDTTTTTTASTANPPATAVEAIEEDDEFEEFEPCQWNKNEEDAEDSQQWQVCTYYDCFSYYYYFNVVEYTSLKFSFYFMNRPHPHQDNWDDDDIDDQFTMQLRAELSKSE